MVDKQNIMEDSLKIVGEDKVPITLNDQSRSNHIEQDKEANAQKAEQSHDDMHDKLEVMKGDLANINSDLDLHLGWPPDPLLEHSRHTLAPKPSYLGDDGDHINHGDHGRYGTAEQTKAIEDAEQTKGEP